jgi:hypothetical protein
VREGFALPPGFHTLVWHALDLHDNVLSEYDDVSACDIARDLNLRQLFGEYLSNGDPSALLNAMNPDKISEFLQSTHPQGSKAPSPAKPTAEGVFEKASAHLPPLLLQSLPSPVGPSDTWVDPTLELAGALRRGGWTAKGPPPNWQYAIRHCTMPSAKAMDDLVQRHKLTDVGGKDLRFSEREPQPNSVVFKRGVLVVATREYIYPRRVVWFADSDLLWVVVRLAGATRAAFPVYVIVSPLASHYEESDLRVFTLKSVKPSLLCLVTVEFEKLKKGLNAPETSARLIEKHNPDRTNFKSTASTPPFPAEAKRATRRSKFAATPPPPPDMDSGDETQDIDSGDQHTCETCVKSFPKAVGLSVHRTRMSGTKGHPVVTKKAPTEKRKTTPKTPETSQTLTGFPCIAPFCSQVFLTQTALSSHKGSHTKKQRLCDDDDGLVVPTLTQTAQLRKDMILQGQKVGRADCQAAQLREDMILQEQKEGREKIRQAAQLREDKILEKQNEDQKAQLQLVAAERDKAQQLVIDEREKHAELMEKYRNQQHQLAIKERADSKQVMLAQLGVMSTIATRSSTNQPAPPGERDPTSILQDTDPSLTIELFADATPEEYLATMKAIKLLGEKIVVRNALAALQAERALNAKTI